MWWDAKGAVHAELQLVSKSLSSSFLKKSPHPRPPTPHVRLTTTLSLSSRARRKTERQEACIPPGPKAFYRPSHILFLFFSHHQPPTNNTRKGSALCLDGGVSVLSVLIWCLIQQRAWQLTCLAEVSVIDEVRLAEVNSVLMWSRCWWRVLSPTDCPGTFWQVTV